MVMKGSRGMRETVLFIHFADKDRRNRLARALFPLHVRIRDISLEDYGKPVGFLAGIRELAPEGGLCTGEEISGELLVMAGIGSARMDLALKAIRKSGVLVPYKAVLTSTNQNWNVWKLFEEIKKEHQRMADT